MGQSHEAPRRQTLRQGELQRHPPRGVGCQLRIEERRLLQVLAQLHIGHGRGLFFTFIVACQSRLIAALLVRLDGVKPGYPALQGVINVCRTINHNLIQHHRCLVNGHCRLGQSPGTETCSAKPYPSGHPRLREERLVERAEVERRSRQARLVERTVEVETAPRAKAPP